MIKPNEKLFTMLIQWNPSCEAIPFAPEKWPFKRGGLSSGVEINTFMLRFTLSSGLSKGGGLSSGWPLKRGSTVMRTALFDHPPLAGPCNFPDEVLPYSVDFLYFKCLI